MDNSFVEIRNLEKTYGSHRVLKDISFNVNEGEILGFLGPNGAGKTTTMNIITGVMEQTSGTVIIDGYDTQADSIRARKLIGYLPEIPPVYGDLTVDEYLEFVSEIKQLNYRAITNDIQKIKVNLGLTDFGGRLIKNLSKGYKQRVGFAQALLGNPKLIILDEPTVGLDPKQIIEIRELIKRLGRKHTVIFSSHTLSEISAVCDRVLIIDNGEIVAQDTVSTLSSELYEEVKLYVIIEGPKKEIQTILRNIPGVNKVIDSTVEVNNQKATGYYVLTSNDYEVRQRIFMSMSRNNYCILEMRKYEMSLEDIFLKVTNGNKVLQ